MESDVFMLDFLKEKDKWISNYGKILDRISFAIESLRGKKERFNPVYKLLESEQLKDLYWQFMFDVVRVESIKVGYQCLKLDPTLF